MTTFINILLLFLCLIALVKGSSIFVKQASAIARRYRIPEFLIGITIVAIGTSLPELAIGISSAIKGNAQIPTANILGSSIANIGLILSITSLFAAIKIEKKHLKFELPFAIIGVLVFLGILYLSNGTLGSLQGIFLILIFVGYFLFQFFKSKKENGFDGTHNNTKISIPLLILGFALLIFGGKYTVDYAVKVSDLLNVSQGFLGFTVLSLASTLPELIVTVIAIRKKRYELGLGNIVGSISFNLFLITGVLSQIQELSFQMYIPELMILLGYIVALVVVAFIGKKYYVSRLEGFLILLSYIALLIYLFFK